LTPGRNDPCLCGSGKKYKKCCAQRLGGAQGGAAKDITGTPSATAPDLRALFALLAAGRHAELETSARGLLDHYNDTGILWKMLGAALFAQGKDALAALETAATLLPRDPESHTNLGNVLRAQGRLEDAVARHRRAIELKPDYAEAHNNLGSVLRDLKHLGQAAASYRKAISFKPDFAMAHNNLGLALQGLGRPDEAMASHRRALALKPELVEAHCNLANCLRGQGRLEEALQSYRRAVELRPSDNEALINLSDTLLALGRLDQAAQSYRRVLQFRPDSAEAHNNLGNALRDMGQLEEAAASYRRAVLLRPDYAKVHNNLGNALLDLGRIEEAVASYSRALELEPDFAKAHSNLGSAFRELGRLDEAEECYRRALAVRAESAEVLTNLGVVQRLQGRADEAEASLRRALGIDPTATSTITSLAELHADRGQFAEAEDLYRKACAVQPDSAQAWGGMAALRKMTITDSAWITEAQRIAQRPLRPRDEAHLRYAIGKYFDDVQDYEQAFLSYRQANEIAKAYSPAHDQEHLARTFEFITRLYDREWLELARAGSNSSPRPIFIVGMPRSGTSLAEQILASHPAVFGAGELSFWKTASLKVGAAALQDGANGSDLAQLADEYLRLLAGLSPDAARVVDKMPANFAHLGMIHAALPNARIIHMRRNPIDTCLSIYFQNFHVAHTYANDLEDLAHYYGEYEHLMQHWRSMLPPGAILDVPYEALVADQELWSRKMVEFVGLPWDPACIDFHLANRRVSTFSKWQVRQKISKTSVERWRNYALFVGPLTRLTESSAAADTEKPTGSRPASLRSHISV
jgi:tetratricopeptide (TPR) repeat protein